jgi:hypothetical protein
MRRHAGNKMCLHSCCDFWLTAQDGLTEGFVSWIIDLRTTNCHFVLRKWPMSKQFSHTTTMSCLADVKLNRTRKLLAWNLLSYCTDFHVKKSCYRTGDIRFESLPVHRLSWLRFIVACTQSLYRLFPYPFQFIIHQSSYQTILHLLWERAYVITSYCRKP